MNINVIIPPSESDVFTCSVAIAEPVHSPGDCLRFVVLGPPIDVGGCTFHTEITRANVEDIFL